MTTHRSAIAILRATPGVLEAIFAALPPELVTTPLDKDWAPRDVVAHLILTDRLSSIGRIRRVVDEEDPELPAFDETRELLASGLQLQPVEWLLEELDRGRQGGVRWLTTLGPDDLARTGRHAEAGRISGEDLLFHAAYHDADHVRQLQAMIAGVFEPLRGPMRMY